MRSEFKLAKETSECQNFLKSAADSFFNFLHTSFSEKLEGLFQIDDKPSRFSVVLTVFNQFGKLSGRDVMSMNAFLTKVLSSDCVILCQNFITRRMLLNVEGMAPKSPYTIVINYKKGLMFRFISVANPPPPTGFNCSIHLFKVRGAKAVAFCC